MAATALLLAGQVDRAQDQLEQFVSLHREARSAHQTMARLLPVYPAVADRDVSFESLAEGRPWGRYLLLRGVPENACSLVESQLKVHRRQAQEDGTRTLGSRPSPTAASTSLTAWRAAARPMSGGSP